MSHCNPGSNVISLRRDRSRDGSALSIVCALLAVGFANDARADDNRSASSQSAELPSVPKGFEVQLFAREPLVRNPCSMAFDARGRLFVGMGPQYRNPTPETPGDSVVIVHDRDGDGIAESSTVFATGLNCIQSLAWRGGELWIANSPDLTVVRDLDGDDVADEYVQIFTDLGNIEHALHGLNWGPDGRLYMSKGNSKGLNTPERYAPRAFRELLGLADPPGAVDLPPPRKFTPSEYRRTFQDPADDWGRMGGVLRCERDGSGLEIVTRGLRNPWDITFDSGFNGLGTDNDQSEGDRQFMPFFGAHFGWGHSWSSDWTGRTNAPTVPITGPTYPGSGTGIVFYDAPQFPPEFQHAFFWNDWLRKSTYIYRPQWNGSLLSHDGAWEKFVDGTDVLYRPVDLEVGPDGALWVLGWGKEYGVKWSADGRQVNEGRIFRIAATGTPPSPQNPAKARRALTEWSFENLTKDLGSPLPVRRIDAQDELVHRGGLIRDDLLHWLKRSDLREMEQTWGLWTLGRLAADDQQIDATFARWTKPEHALNVRLQSLRILARRVQSSRERQLPPAEIAAALRDRNPRVRFEAVQAVWQARGIGHVQAIQVLAASETDRGTFYCAWGTLRDLCDAETLRVMLADKRSGLRRAALLALADRGELSVESAEALVGDRDPETASVAALWMARRRGNPLVMVEPSPGTFDHEVEVTLIPGIKPSQIRYTLDGSVPQITSRGADGPILLRETTTLKASLFVEGRPVGQPTEAVFRRRSESELLAQAAIRDPMGTMRFRLSKERLQPGVRVYTDREYTISGVPPALSGTMFLQSANDDAGLSGEAAFSFEALLPLRVMIAHDNRIVPRPQWLQQGWQETTLDILTTDSTFRVFARTFAPGRVVLGGNTDDGSSSGKSNYFVLLQTALAPPAQSTTIEQGLASLKVGRADRGRALFFAAGGVSCAGCHRVGLEGHAYGPDLSALGERGQPEALVRSILDPSAIISEGFSQQTIITHEGRVVTGILRDESDGFLTLARQDGEPIRISKSEIDERASQHVSAMPPFGPLLAAEQVADLVAFLTQPVKSVAAINDTSAQKPSTSFTVTTKDDRLTITCDGRPLGDYVFVDSKIRRPHFQNLCAPDGTQVTRRHPPEEGKDAVDHAEMHPGLWLGFGDISGEDFWRNKGTIRHDRFVEAPAVRSGVLSWTSENTLLGKSGNEMARQVTRFTISRQDEACLLTWDAEFTPTIDNFFFGDQEEMGLGVRVATPLTETNGGVITASTGDRTAKATWGKPYAWCDYSGTIDGRKAGVTIIPHPKNFRQSWWHNRDYGVFVANPFGRQALKQGDVSRVVVGKDEKFRLRFGVLLHSSKSDAPFDVAGACRRFLEAQSESAR